MARTTLDIDGPILDEVKALQTREGRSLGRLVSELLAEALAGRRRSPAEATLEWLSRPMHALVDLDDKDALYAALDETDATGKRGRRATRPTPTSAASPSSTSATR